MTEKKGKREVLIYKGRRVVDISPMMIILVPLAFLFVWTLRRYHQHKCFELSADPKCYSGKISITVMIFFAILFAALAAEMDSQIAKKK